MSEGDEFELSSLSLPLPPSCVAFSPALHDHLVIGTYFLEQNDESKSEASHGPQTRSGSLILFRLTDGKLHECNTVPSSSGILDIAFSPHDPTLLCAATSTGSLTVHHVQETESSVDLVPTHTLQAFDLSTLVLDLVFHPTDQNIVGVTLSTGEVAVVTISPTSTETLTTHSLEAWTLAYSPCGTHIYSGSDAATLSISPGVLTDRRTHNAGVTAILPLLSSESKHLLLTGSYDDHLRVVRMAPGQRTQTLVSLDLGGGVWRLQIIAETPGRWTVLASCMHAGAAVVQVSCADWAGEQEAWTAEVLQRFTRHRSMNYGSDVMVGSGRRRTVVSTSFYDRLVCVWEADVDE